MIIVFLLSFFKKTSGLSSTLWLFESNPIHDSLVLVDPSTQEIKAIKTYNFLVWLNKYFKVM